MIFILAGSHTEAQNYVRDERISWSSYLIASNADDDLRGRRVTSSDTLIILSGFQHAPQAQAVLTDFAYLCFMGGIPDKILWLGEGHLADLAPWLAPWLLAAPYVPNLRDQAEVEQWLST